jgi:hypothetical protein
VTLLVQDRDDDAQAVHCPGVITRVSILAIRVSATISRLDLCQRQGVVFSPTSTQTSEGAVVGKEKRGTAPSTRDRPLFVRTGTKN